MNYRNLNVEQLDDFLTRPDCIVLDQRDVKTYRVAHLPDAMLVNDALIMQLVRKHKTTPVLVYCYRGNSSRDLATLLTNFGLTEVYNLEGGWQAWEVYQANNPTILSPGLERWLVEQGFDQHNLDSTISHGMTPIMQAALLAEDSFLNELLKVGADLNKVNHDGNNALWFASFSECLECIDSLIQRGIEINHCNDNGATSLIYAASAGKLKVVKALVMAGANLYQSTLDGFNALDSAATLEILKYLKPQYKAA